MHLRAVVTAACWSPDVAEALAKIVLEDVSLEDSPAARSLRRAFVVSERSLAGTVSVVRVVVTVPFNTRTDTMRHVVTPVADALSVGLASAAAACWAVEAD